MNIGLEDNFASHFEHIADLAPHRVAVVAGERVLTWAQFDEQADRLAGHLAARGIAAGQRVALHARNSPEYLVALFALLKLTATPVNVNYRYRAEEVRHILASSRARAVIADSDLVDIAREAAAPLHDCRLVVAIDPVAGFGRAVAAADRHPRRPRGDTEWLLFTGGTTGYPKAVLGSHTDRLRGVRTGWFDALGLTARADEVEALHQALDLDPYGPGGMVLLPAPPLMHGTGLYSALGALAIGAPVALLSGRSTTGADILRAIRRHRVTDLVIVGDAFALRLLDAIDEATAAGLPAGIDTLRRIRSIGAVWSTGVKRRLLTHADLALIDTIAASEGGIYATSTVTRASVEDEAGTFRLAPRARLLDENDRDVEPGSGTIGLLAAPVAPGAGYEGDPERTAGAFHDVGGVRYSVPGDMALLEADGRLRLLGRGSSVINTGGEKVYTDEVELVLLEHPAVRDAVVLGVPDPRWGSTVVAVVSREPGATVGPDELASFVATRLAGYKKPRRIVFVPEVERANTGKADLRWARRQFEDQHTVPAR